MTAYNDVSFISGRDTESDSELRSRIQNNIQSLSRGVIESIKTALADLSDPITGKRVVFNEVIRDVDNIKPVKVYIDDGTGLEPSFREVGYEELASNPSATTADAIASSRTKKRFQLNYKPITPAFIESVKEESYDLSVEANRKYNLVINSTTIERTLKSDSFTDSGKKTTAEELVNEINRVENISDGGVKVIARTSRNGKQVLIQLADYSNNTLQLTEATGSTFLNILGFPTSTSYSLQLYKQELSTSTPELIPPTITETSGYTINPYLGLLELVVPFKGYSLSAGSPLNFIKITAPKFFTNVFANASLLIVADNNPKEKSYSTNLYYRTTTEEKGGTGNYTEFKSEDLAKAFPYDSAITTEPNYDLQKYDVIIESGNNVASNIDIKSYTKNPNNDVVTIKVNITSDIAFIQKFRINDRVLISGLQDENNNGYFLPESWTVNSSTSLLTFQVSNKNGSTEPTTGDETSGKLNIYPVRRISGYSVTAGKATITLDPPLLKGETEGQPPKLVIIPHDVKQLYNLWINKNINALTDGVSVIYDDSVPPTLSLASKSLGSDGQIQVVGGTGTRNIVFPSGIHKGTKAYAAYTGLIELANKTIYGEDSDLETFPGIGAAGVNFEIAAPSVKEIPINLKVTLNTGYSLSNVQDDIKSVVSGYVNSRGIGKSIIIEEIRSRVLNLLSIYDVETVPKEGDNITVNSNEIGRTRGSIIEVTNV